MTEPSFPPLMSGQLVEGQIDPFDKACALAGLGCDAGLVVYDQNIDALRAAIVFAPEVPLIEAMAMFPLCGVGFQNALGALAPPEVAVHLEWQGGIRVNGAKCGSLQVSASTDDPNAEPDWMVVGLELPLLLAGVPGENPDQTALSEEGCAEIDPKTLLESWARHTLVWINRWTDEGGEPLQAEWRGLAQDMGEEIEIMGKSGNFLGVDENFGMLLRDQDKTHLIQLTELLKG